MFSAENEFKDGDDEHGLSMAPLSEDSKAPVSFSRSASDIPTRPRIRSPFGSNAGREGSETDIRQLMLETGRNDSNSSQSGTLVADATSAAMLDRTMSSKSDGNESLRTVRLGSAADSDDEGSERGDSVDADDSHSGGISDKAGIILVSHNERWLVTEWLRYIHVLGRVFTTSLSSYPNSWLPVFPQFSSLFWNPNILCWIKDMVVIQPQETSLHQKMSQISPGQS